jgi:hypothetical protein
MWAIGNLREGERATYRLIHLEKALYTAFLPTYREGTQNGFK